MIRLQEEIKEFSSPLLATAIHNGHFIRPEINPYLAIDEWSRLREEDPCTEYFTAVSASSVVVGTSRFEVDVNRPRERAVYRTPKESWGIQVWKEDVPVSVWEYSLGEYDYFYNLMERIIARFIDYWGYVLVYDIHSYNYRRSGRNAQEALPEENPEVNIGTGSMNRQRWSPVVEHFSGAMENYLFEGRKLQVAENIRFKGGYMAQWIHSKFPDTSCVLSIEFKKMFMDEWTGAVDLVKINELKNALKETVPAVLNAAEGVASHLD